MHDSVVESATAALRELLARGRYQPGDRLAPERELAEQMGLSRPALREALRRLTDAGLLVARRGSGTFVAEVDLAAVFAVRLRLETLAAAEAARNRTPEQLAQLEAACVALGRALGDAQAFAELDARIHELLADAAGNPVLLDALRRLVELTRLSRAVTGSERATRETVRKRMRALVRAVRAGDADGAERAMEEHLRAVALVAGEAARDRTVRRPGA